MNRSTAITLVNTALIEDNRVTPDWGYNTFGIDSIRYIFNESSTARVIAVLTFTLGLNRP